MHGYNHEAFDDGWMMVYDSMKQMHGYNHASVQNVVPSILGKKIKWQLYYKKHTSLGKQSLILEKGMNL
jgi:hypothetical protein